MTPPSTPVGTDPEIGFGETDIEELFGVARRFVPEALLDGPGWARVLDRVGDSLPGSAVMSNLAGFEFRLWDAQPSADFGLTLTAPTPLVDFLVDRGRAASPGSRAAGLGAFLSQMRSDAWPASGILEYDVVDVPDGERPDPGLFVNVGPYPENAGVPPPGEVVGLLADAVGMQRNDDERRAVERVCEALPPGGFVHSMGTMPGRGQRAVRVSAKGIEAGEVAGFLRSVGWAGAIRLVEDTLMGMLDVAPGFFVALDVAPHGPLSRIGLGMIPSLMEGPDYVRWLYDVRNDWQPLVEHLVTQGLCLPRKGDALIALPGVHRLLGTLGVFVVFQALAWIKVSVSDHGARAKAYSAIILSQAR